MPISLVHTLIAITSLFGSPVNDPAQLVPADTAVFVEMRDASVWRKQMREHPADDAIIQLLPTQRMLESWQEIKQIMDISPEQFTDQYMGRSVAMAADRVGPNANLVLFSRIDAANSRKLVERFKLTSQDKIGNYQIYTTPENKTLIAISSQWVATARRPHEAYFRKLLQTSPTQGNLATNPIFQKWRQRQPPNAAIKGFLRLSNKQVHILSLSYQPGKLRLHYVGQSPRTKAWLSHIKPAESSDLPLPANILGVFRLNTFTKHPANIAQIDRLIAPLSFEKDILARLAEPIVVFIAQQPTEQANSQKAAFPVVGFAIKLKDRQLANDINQILSNAILAMNATSVKRNRPAMNINCENYRQTLCRSIQTPKHMAIKTAQCTFRNLNLAWSTIGTWMVFCTDPAFLKQCVDVSTGPAKKRFVSQTNQLATHLSQERLIASMFIRTKILSQKLKQWSAMQVSTHQTKQMPLALTQRVVQMFEPYQSMEISVKASPDHLLIGDMQLITHRR